MVHDVWLVHSPWHPCVAHGLFWRDCSKKVAIEGRMHAACVMVLQLAPEP
jgi:hypothetical protein